MGYHLFSIVSLMYIKALEQAFNQEKALIGAFSVIAKSSRAFVSPSFQALVPSTSPVELHVSEGGELKFPLSILLN